MSPALVKKNQATCGHVKILHAIMVIVKCKIYYGFIKEGSLFMYFWARQESIRIYCFSSIIIIICTIMLIQTHFAGGPFVILIPP